MTPSRALRSLASCLLVSLITAVTPRVRADVPSWCDESFTAGQADADAKKLLDARAKLAKCADPICGKHLPDDCREALGRVNKRIPSVTAVALEGSTPLRDFAVTVDGQTMPADGSPVEVEPGKHVFVFTTSDGRTKQVDVDVVESKLGQQVQAVFAAPAPAASTSTPATVGATLAPPISAPTPTPPSSVEPSVGHGAPSSGSSSLKTVGIIATVGGVVLLGVGGILALSAKSKFDGAKSNHCGAAVGGSDDTHCDSVGLDARSGAASTANVATVFWVLGGLATAGGAVLWLTSPSGDKSESVKVGIGAGAVLVQGAF